MVRGMEWRRNERRKVGGERRFYGRGRKEEDYEEGMRWCIEKKSAREAKSDRGTMVRGMEGSRKERRKVGVK